MNNAIKIDDVTLKMDDLITFLNKTGDNGCRLLLGMTITFCTYELLKYAIKEKVKVTAKYSSGEIFLSVN